MQKIHYSELDDMEKYNKEFVKSDYENMNQDEARRKFKTWYSKNLPIDLLTWCRVNEPSDDMIYKKGYWNQITFIRDTIMYMLCKDYEDYINNPVLVINTHTSKSIVLPVYQLNLFDKKMKIIIRNNFYNWKISVDSDVEINVDFMGLFKSDEQIHSVYCEGFKKEQVYDSYSNNKKKFTFEIGDTYLLYTFMFLLKNYMKNKIK